ncbi:uncharacterized protein LOC125508672 isoform X4 [Triticum urartu]|uniref:uncharacterized protein LOC125508672 isoform X4 n=1 Tax=Triticum urartu TaxID=4572 RepID=UPI0020430BEF|nr:uncharacterized protein LOC125508672 isoform X4 [Triticum urartu]
MPPPRACLAAPPDLAASFNLVASSPCFVSSYVDPFALASFPRDQARSGREEPRRCDLLHPAAMAPLPFSFSETSKLARAMHVLLAHAKEKISLNNDPRAKALGLSVPPISSIVDLYFFLIGPSHTMFFLTITYSRQLQSFAYNFILFQHK